MRDILAPEDFEAVAVFWRDVVRRNPAI
jgi:hypothetical protein